MAKPNERDKEIAAKIAPDLARGMQTYDEYVARGEEMGTLARGYKRKWDDLLAHLAAYREEIEARAPEQGGEMRDALEAVAGIRRMAESIERGESWEGGSPDMGTCRILGDIKRISDKARALLARESAEPAEERGPEEGDLVFWPMGDRGMVDFWDDDIEAECKRMGEYKPPIVLMRRSEVEARIGGKA